MWCVLRPAQVRRYVALDRLTINNEIAGFKFATVRRIGHTPVSLCAPARRRNAAFRPLAWPSWRVGGMRS